MEDIFSEVETCQQYPAKFLTTSKIISITIPTNRVGEKDCRFHLMQTHKQVGAYFFHREAISKSKKPQQVNRINRNTHVSLDAVFS